MQLRPAPNRPAPNRPTSSRRRAAPHLAVMLAVAAFCGLIGDAPASIGEDALPTDVAVEELPSESFEFPIDLATALAVAARDNPTIALSREAIMENLALQQQADVLLLPTLAAGGNLRIHRGTLQQPNGNILDVRSQSLYFGSGARTTQAQTVAVPGIRIFAPLGDAWLEPLAARRQTAISQATSRATYNLVLLDVTSTYMNLWAAQQTLERLRQARAEAQRIARAMSAFVQVGQARKSDADRAVVRTLLLDNDISRTEERAGVAAAQLARLLRLDPTVGLRAEAGPMEALELVDPQASQQDLIRTALRYRPEMSARATAIGLAETRIRQELVRPLLPTLSIGYSNGVFGGGSNLAPPSLGRFDGRSDFDAVAFWTLRNLGAGNAALERGRRSELAQAVAEKQATVDRIRQEISEAFALSQARKVQIDAVRRQTAFAEAGFAEDLARVEGGEGLPIEALNSLDLVVAARRDLIRAIADYDLAQVRLFVSLGQPPTAAGLLQSPGTPSP